MLVAKLEKKIQGRWEGASSNRLVDDILGG
jgi:hypothetical protein